MRLAEVLAGFEVALNAVYSPWNASGKQVQVVQGTRGSVTLTADRVVFIGGANFSHDHPSMGDNSITYDVDIVFYSVIRSPDGQAQATTEACQLYTDGMAVLDGNIGVPGLQDVLPLGRGRVLPNAVDKGRECAVSGVVRVVEDY